MAERLWKPEGVNISKGRVRVECVERSHMAVENTGEHRRMLGMKFYITIETFLNNFFFFFHLGIEHVHLLQKMIKMLIIICMFNLFLY